MTHTPDDAAATGAVPPPPYASYGPPMPAQQPYGLSAYPGRGPIGQVRSTGLCFLLMVVTFGIYAWYWYYTVHRDMKRHTGEGLGGGLALVIAFFIGIVMPYITASEIGEMYQRAGRRRPVSGFTGLWYFPGIFLFFIGPIVWFVKVNGALNHYWRSLGA